MARDSQVLGSAPFSEKKDLILKMPPSSTIGQTVIIIIVLLKARPWALLNKTRF